MKIADAMTRDVQVALPEMEICDAARLMAELDVGVLPVSEGGGLVGMITDRDIAVRAVAMRMGPETRVDAIMSPGPRFCYDDDEIDAVLAGMGGLQVRRMPVLDRAHRLVGIVSLSDLALDTPSKAAGETLIDISEPGGAHSQADDADPHAIVAPTIDPESGDRPSDLVLGPVHFSDDEPT
jgi:CBS domain-containing protein